MRPTKKQQLAKLQRHRVLMLEYLRLRLELGDMHGVMDAAADVREIEAAMRVLQK